ncbi:hypothetical protein NQZ68_039206 [Dissostichus eleginoides]|nr:hypothetical protein NQZ68_039206 [Dissostichus eleginoides]
MVAPRSTPPLPPSPVKEASSLAVLCPSDRVPARLRHPGNMKQSRAEMSAGRPICQSVGCGSPEGLMYAQLCTGKSSLSTSMILGSPISPGEAFTPNLDASVAK